MFMVCAGPEIWFPAYVCAYSEEISTIFYRHILSESGDIAAGELSPSETPVTKLFPSCCLCRIADATITLPLRLCGRFTVRIAKIGLRSERFCKYELIYSCHSG